MKLPDMYMEYLEAVFIAINALTFSVQVEIVYVRTNTRNNTVFAVLDENDDEKRYTKK